MKFKFILIGSLIAIPAMAQEAQQPSEYVLKITPQELDQIGKALGMLPYNDVAQMVQKLRQQVVQQQQQSEKKVEEPKK